MANTYPGRYLDVSNKTLEGRINELEALVKSRIDDEERTWELLQNRLMNDDEWRNYHNREIESLKTRIATLEQQLAVRRRSR